MRQPDLFLPMCARAITRQGQLFNTEGPAAVAFCCPECGHYLERTPSGYLACPLGHGKLIRLPGEPEPADDWDWYDPPAAA